MTLRLATSTDAFDALHRAVDGKGTRPVKIDRALLRALLIDHSRLLALHRGQTEEPQS